jgi:hypothetical protein
MINVAKTMTFVEPDLVWSCSLRNASIDDGCSNATTPISLASKPQKVLGDPGKMIPIGFEKNVWKIN